MKADESLNHFEGKADEAFESERDVPGVATWLDEADRALGDCLKRIENVSPDAVPHQGLRRELIFLLRAARADLVTRYLEATCPPKS